MLTYRFLAQLHAVIPVEDVRNGIIARSQILPQSQIPAKRIDKLFKHR